MIGPSEHLFHLGFRSRPEASGGRWSRRPSTWRLARKLTASPPTGLGISGQLINDREVDKKNFRYEPCFSAYYAFFFHFLSPSRHDAINALMALLFNNAKSFFVGKITEHWVGVFDFTKAFDRHPKGAIIIIARHCTYTSLHENYLIDNQPYKTLRIWRENSESNPSNQTIDTQVVTKLYSPDIWKYSRQN